MKVAMFRTQALVFSTALLISGCPSTDVAQPGETLNSREEAGTVLVSVNSIAPWDQVSAALQPKFTMASGDVALDKVAPRTQRLVEQTLQAFGFTLGVGLPQSFTEATKTTGLKETSSLKQAGEETSSNFESTRSSDSSKTKTLQPGEAPDVPEGLPAGAERLTAKSADGDIGLDPFLQYQAASALYQEVQLLNREVNFAASRRCYVPYLVRLQLAAIPYRQNVGYDLHTKIGFFHGAGDDPSIMTLTETNVSKQAQTCLNANTPYVVPILATDNLERAVNSRASEVARQIGLAVNFMVKGIGGNVGFNNANQQIRAILADDVNSLFTVSRLTDNSLYVRIGANQQAAVKEALVGRTYDVSLLLLVPLGFFQQETALKAAFAAPPTPATKPQPVFYPRISMITRNDFRKSDKGESLPDPTSDQTLDRYETALAPFLRVPAIKTKWDSVEKLEKLCHILELRPAVYQSNYREFKKALSATQCKANFIELAASEGMAKALWLAIAQADADSPHKNASFELPVSPDISIKSQTVLLREEKDKPVKAVLREASGIVPGDLAAWLVPASGNRGEGYVAEQVTVDADSNTVSLTFPSFSKLELKKADIDQRRLIVERRDCPVPVWPVCKGSDIPTHFAVNYVKLPKEAKKPRLVLSSPQSEIVLRDNEVPTIKLHIDKLKDKEAVISLKGALIDTAQREGEKPPELEVVRDKVTVTKDTTVRLTLKNLRVGGTVTVTATGMKDEDGKKVETGKTSFDLKVVKDK